MPGIAVVTNPRSRANRRDPRIAGQLAYLLGSKGEVAQPKDIAELVETAKRFRDLGIDVLAINGGDGTNHTVLTAFVAAYGDQPLPPIALLRGGTMNTVASGIGIKGTPAELLGRLVSRYHAGEPIGSVERNLLHVTGDRPQYGFLFGNGLISNFLEVYYEGSEPSPTKAAWILAKAILSALVGGDLIRRLMQPVEVQVTLDDDGTWPWRQYLCVAAGTVDDIGLRFRPFYDAPRYPGRLQALGLACSPLDVVWELPRIRLARPTKHRDIGSAVVESVRMTAQREIPYMIDGDFHVGGQTLEIRVGPRVKLLLP